MCTLQRNSVVPLVRLCAIRAAVENRIFVVLAGDRNTCSIVSARQLGCQRNSRRPLLDMGRRVSRRGWKSGLDANHQSPMRNYPRWTLLITTHEWLIYQAEERFRSYDCHLWERFEQWNTIQLVDQWHNDRIDHEWRQCYGSEPGHNVRVWLSFGSVGEIGCLRVHHYYLLWVGNAWNWNWTSHASRYTIPNHARPGPP
jgi:hypothetical protein